MSNSRIHGTGIPLRAPVGLVGTTHVVHGSNMNLPQKATNRKMQQTCVGRSANGIEGSLLLQMGVCVNCSWHVIWKGNNDSLKNNHPVGKKFGKHFWETFFGGKKFDFDQAFQQQRWPGCLEWSSQKGVVLGGWVEFQAQKRPDKFTGVNPCWGTWGTAPYVRIPAACVPALKICPVHKCLLI